MRVLDETDLEILRMLGEDARRPFSDIGDAVGLSGPAVSDRVTKLREAGVLRRFTVDVDRSQLHAGVPVFVRVHDGDDVDALRDRVGASDAVEHVFVTADGEVWFSARAQVQNVRAWIDELLAAETGAAVTDDAETHAGTDAVGAATDGTPSGRVDAVPDYSVTLLDAVQWRPSLDGAEFALACAECDNTVDSEGETSRIDGELYHFCCPSCRSRFEERYERIEEGA